MSAVTLAAGAVIMTLFGGCVAVMVHLAHRIHRGAVETEVRR